MKLNDVLLHVDVAYVAAMLMSNVTFLQKVGKAKHLTMLMPSGKKLIKKIQLQNS